MSETPPSSRPWRILFMGTPQFAVPCLQALIDSPDSVVAVVAQPDRPSGRGQKLQSPPTVQLAREHGIPTLQPAKVRGPDFPEALAAFQPDLAVVVAYGRILTGAVLAVPAHGCVNVHASLLPKYRGAAPIQWAVLRGEAVTGVTTMQMDEGLDTGDMLLKRELAIGPRETSGQLHDRLSELGASLLIETIAGLKAGTVPRIPQDHAAATHAPLLKKEDGQIDWARPAIGLDWHVRGMSPWPGAFAFLEGRRIVVLEGAPDPAARGFSREATPGTVIDAGPAGIRVSTGEGVYTITTLKPENARAMTVREFLMGHRVPPGAHFTRDQE